MKRLLMIIVYGCLSTDLWGVELELNFILEPSETTSTMSLSTGGSDTVVTTYTGNAVARVEIDSETLVPQSIEFIGGRMSISDFVLRVTSLINFTGIGILNTGLALASDGASARFVTLNPPAPITSDGELLEVERHQSILDQGRALLTITVLGQSETLVNDFSQAPESGELGGSAKLTIQEISRSPAVVRLRFSIVSQFDDESSELIEGSNATLMTSERGEIVGFADGAILTRYGEWLNDSGLDPFDPPTENLYGIPIPLLYAFNLSIEEDTVPIRFSVGESSVLSFELPEQGLNASLLPEISYTLEGDSWIPVPEDLMIDGLASFEKGRSGESKIRLTSDQFQFFRFGVGL